jgi:hypothetical protein
VRETEFRLYLADRLGERSVDSYVAYCRRVERDLNLNLDISDLSDVGIGDIAERLRTVGTPERSLKNCLSGLRAYARFDGGGDFEASSRTMEITPEQRRAWANGTANSPFNQWLDGQVKDEEGRLSLEKLRAVASSYGIDGLDGYAHLNAGQQRMNIGNRLRRIVPSSAYGLVPPAFGLKAAAIADAAPPPPLDEAPRRDSVRQATVIELLVIYGEIMDELRGRRVVRTGNSPVGDYAELLFAQAFDWNLEPNSAAGHDATDARGLRYQIKARRLTARNGSRQLSAIRRLNDGTFDYLAAVLFDSSFKVLRAILIPHSLVSARAKRVEHTNSWRFILDDRVWQAPGVRDVTAELAVAASRPLS